jgi:hypothetical protein
MDADMLVAGRCLSATVEGQASARVSGTCMAMGEAAGIAAAMALQCGGAIVEVDLPELQARLEERGGLP